MKRTARLVKANGDWGKYAVEPPVFASALVYVTVHGDVTEVAAECTPLLTLLRLPERLAPAEALARIGYTLEKPPPVLELGEETAEPDGAGFYWLTSDQAPGIVRVIGTEFWIAGSGWCSLKDLTNARFRRIIVKEQP